MAEFHEEVVPDQECFNLYMGRHKTDLRIPGKLRCSIPTGNIPKKLMKAINVYTLKFWPLAASKLNLSDFH